MQLCSLWGPLLAKVEMHEIFLLDRTKTKWIMDEGSVNNIKSVSGYCFSAPVLGKRQYLRVKRRQTQRSSFVDSACIRCGYRINKGWELLWPGVKMDYLDETCKISVKECSSTALLTATTTHSHRNSRQKHSGKVAEAEILMNLPPIFCHFLQKTKQNPLSYGILKRWMDVFCLPLDTLKNIWKHKSTAQMSLFNHISQKWLPNQNHHYCFLSSPLFLSTRCWNQHLSGDI